MKKRKISKIRQRDFKRIREKDRQRRSSIEIIGVPVEKGEEETTNTTDHFKKTSLKI